MLNKYPKMYWVFYCRDTYDDSSFYTTEKAMMNIFEI